MKKIAIILCILFLLTLLVGCKRNLYMFKEPIEEIETIEIVFAQDPFEYTVVKTLSNEEKTAFLEDFQEILFDTYIFGDPPQIHGDSVKITYYDGTYEIICFYWANYVKNGYNYMVRKNCREEDFKNLLEKYS